MKILIPVDSKTYAKSVTEFVGSHKWPGQPQFKIIHAIDPIFLGFDISATQIKSYSEERHRLGRSLIMEVGTAIRLAYPTADIEEDVIDGNPKDIILEIAKNWKADLILVGSHGRTGLEMFWLGSVSLAILSSAPCAVMVIRLPKTLSQEEQTAQKKVESVH